MTKAKTLDFTIREARAEDMAAIDAINSVNPNDRPEAVDMLRRCVADSDARGLKIHRSMQHFEADDISLLTPLMRAVEALGIPVLLHSWAWFGQDSEAAPRRVIALARAFPHITFIMAHCGGMGFFDLQPLARLRAVDQLDNLYVDLSVILDDLDGSPIWPMLKWILETIGLDRVMMGSDFPDYSLADTLRLVHALGWTEEDLSMVMGGNAQQLFAL